MTTITTTLTHESAIAQLKEIMDAASIGAFPDVNNFYIESHANLLLRTQESGNTQEGDLKEIAKFIDGLRNVYGGAK